MDGAENQSVSQKLPIPSMGQFCLVRPNEKCLKGVCVGIDNFMFHSGP